MPILRDFPSRRAGLLILAASCLGGCALAPQYVRPDIEVPAQFKEAQGWVQAAPADEASRGTWWTVFGDRWLDDTLPLVSVSNQNVAIATAAYAQARALVSQQRAALFPSLTLDGGVTRSGGGSGAVSGTTAGSTTSSSRTGTTMRLSLGGSWEPDVWGRLGASVNNAQANAAASEADLAAATLSAQAELVTDYFSVRFSDLQAALLAQSIDGYQRVLQITQNRYAAGIAPKSDVLQAQTQLANAQAELSGLDRQRAQFEHAIAVLLGKAPAAFSLPPLQQWTSAIPVVPAALPSGLLQRRPDIAASERRVAAANESIGIARSAYFPALTLNASYGSNASRLPELLTASSTLWSLGIAAAQTLFDAGATKARVEEARSAYDQTVARYRQTVLVAFQEVEDYLAASQVLDRQQQLRQDAVRAASEAEVQMLNRYKAGQVSYSEVVTAQVTALTAKRALLQTQADRQTASVGLLQALGGGWSSDQIASNAAP
ncbi:efflux transporter outer membrane subunit [Noviherbaspirillum galbum]|uniref:Efflux transporter outer membrane subunit n=1 Tax=Noviherbaspirillum galbum TaxID=2709383 RepID=A0A6B3SS86_9BURK|nr:efflux transporter outer membrane subunit [Noviherbaspirillum galbum]